MYTEILEYWVVWLCPDVQHKHLWNRQLFTKHVRIQKCNHFQKLNAAGETLLMPQPDVGSIFILAVYVNPLTMFRLFSTSTCLLGNQTWDESSLLWWTFTWRIISDITTSCKAWLLFVHNRTSCSMFTAGTKTGSRHFRAQQTAAAHSLGWI